MDLENIELGEVLGEGAYGIVYKGRNKITNEFVAVKKVKVQDKENGIPSTTIREISILKNLAHKNIVQLKKVIYDFEDIYLIFEYVPFDLKSIINNRMSVKKFFSESKVQSFAYQLLEALTYCHSNSIFHRDLKPQNILISKNLTLKLADFGMARSVCIPLRKYTPEIVTLWYRPPEVLIEEEYYDLSVDIWSAACIIYEMYTLEVLFRGDSEISQLKKIYSVLGPPTNYNNENNPYTSEKNKYADILGNGSHFKNNFCLEDKKLEGLLRSMLHYNPLDRITAEDALFHEYFSNFQ